MHDPCKPWRCKGELFCMYLYTYTKTHKGLVHWDHEIHSDIGSCSDDDLSVGMEHHWVFPSLPLKWKQLCFNSKTDDGYFQVPTQISLVETTAEADICVRSLFEEGVPLGRYPKCNQT